MESNWASEHLQVIRTLMERSAIYRRALAPIMTVAGVIGIAAAIVPCFVQLKSLRAFSLFWMGVGVIAAAAALLLVRRQALKEAEPFWSLPTRRVTHAVSPAFLIGLASGLLAVFNEPLVSPPALAIVWIAAYGCAVHAAGFFMPRGMKLLGWLFVLSAALLAGSYGYCSWLQSPEAAHYIMGAFFGVLHLAYGIYLYFTEKAKQAA